MSTHPNVILLLALTPHDLSRRTMAAILAEHAKPTFGGDDVEIEGETFHSAVMESDYLEGVQISAKEGDLVFWDLVTYGYGEVISWDDLVKQKTALETWARGVCEKYKCDYRIEVSANYW